MIKQYYILILIYCQILKQLFYLGAKCSGDSLILNKNKATILMIDLRTRALWINLIVINQDQNILEINISVITCVCCVTLERERERGITQESYPGSPNPATFSPHCNTPFPQNNIIILKQSEFNNNGHVTLLFKII